MTPHQLRTIIRHWGRGEGWHDTVQQFALDVPAHERTVYKWLSAERGIRPMVAARIRSLPKNAKPVKR